MRPPVGTAGLCGGSEYRRDEIPEHDVQIGLGQKNPRRSLKFGGEHYADRSDVGE